MNNVWYTFIMSVLIVGFYSNDTAALTGLSDKKYGVDFLRIIGDIDASLLELSTHNRGCNHISFSEIKNKFENLNSWGMETTLDITNCNPDMIRDAEIIKRYVHELCDLIKMKRFGETVVVQCGEGEEIAGFTMTQIIETSLISGHFVDDTNAIYINVFSCKLYDPYIVAEFTKKFFDGDQCIMNILLRK